MKIKTNHKPRAIISGYELTSKERQEFDYLDNPKDGSFFKYKGQVYDLGEVMRLDVQGYWHGSIGLSAYSGLLVRVADSESIVVGYSYEE